MYMVYMVYMYIYVRIYVLIIFYVLRYIMYNNNRGVSLGFWHKCSFLGVFHYTPILFIIAVYCFCFLKLVGLFKNLKTNSGPI